MASQTIYRTPLGQQALQGLYRRQLSALGISWESRMVDTEFGSTHVLVTGPRQGPALVLFHGGNSTNPYTLKGFLPLVEDFRVYAPDTVGHPGFSAQRFLSSRDLSYGRWAAGILGGLGLERASFLGVSYGGGILLRLASFAPGLVTKGVLVVPSAVANCSTASLLVKLGLPMLLYRLFPSPGRLKKAVHPLFLDTPLDEDTLEMVRLVFQQVKVQVEMPRDTTREELLNYRAPTLVIAAAGDVLFPGHQVISRAREIIPHLAGAHLYPGSHNLMGSPRQGPAINQQIKEFLLEPAGEVTL